MTGISRVTGTSWAPDLAILAGSGHEALAMHIAQALGVSTLPVARERFPDGELSVLAEADGTWTLHAHLDLAENSSALDDHEWPEAGNTPQLPGSFGDPHHVSHVLVGERGFLSEHGRTLGPDDDASMRELAGDVDAA